MVHNQPILANGVTWGSEINGLLICFVGSWGEISPRNNWSYSRDNGVFLGIITHKYPLYRAS